MKFSCEKYLLQNATATAARAAAAKSPIPALEGLLIEAGSDVKITGYDLKKGIYTYLEADVAEPGNKWNRWFVPAVSLDVPGVPRGYFVTATKP